MNRWTSGKEEPPNIPNNNTYMFSIVHEPLSLPIVLRMHKNTRPTSRLHFLTRLRDFRSSTSDQQNNYLLSKCDSWTTCR